MSIPEHITIPPPSIKETIHKTATYVHLNGKAFETTIKENNKSSNKFGFINTDDTYNEYYQYVVDHVEELGILTPESNDQIANNDAEDEDNDDEEEDPEEEALLKTMKPLEFLVSLPPITVKDLEVIKLTALFVAQNGNAYIDSIKEKYEGSQAAQFSFLDDNHSFHELFQIYIKQYKNLINNEEPQSFGDDNSILERSIIRSKYNLKTKAKSLRLAKTEELNKKKLAVINWQDSIIVETIEFNEIDLISELPVPLTIAELQFRSLEAKSKEVTEFKTTAVSLGKSKMKIKEFGKTRLQSVNGNNNKKEKLIECPITGKMIPESDFERHIQILLGDPKYKEEKANYEAKIKNSNLSTVEVVDNIKNLFKPTENNNNKRQKVQWDGYNSSVKFIEAKNSAAKEDVDEYKRKIELQNKIGPQLPPKSKE